MIFIFIQVELIRITDPVLCKLRNRNICFFLTFKLYLQMQRIWCKKKVLFWCVVGVFLWLIFRPKKYTVKFEAIISNSKPIDVWEYVADFSNMKKLNPTM